MGSGRIVGFVDFQGCGVGCVGGITVEELKVVWVFGARITLVVVEGGDGGEGGAVCQLYSVLAEESMAKMTSLWRWEWKGMFSRSSPPSTRVRLRWWEILEVEGGRHRRGWVGIRQCRCWSR